MKKGVLFIGGLACFAILYLFTNRAVGQESNHWTGSNFKATFSDELIVGFKRIKPKAGYTLLIISGKLHCSDENWSAPINEIFVNMTGSGTGADEDRSMVIAVGNQPCGFYQAVSAGASGSVQLTSPDTGEGFKIWRETDGGPVVLTPTKIPCRLCLVFGVPKPPVNEYTLGFAGSIFKAPISEP